jgi:hypothetical protein
MCYSDYAASPLLQTKYTVVLRKTYALYSWVSLIKYTVFWFKPTKNMQKTCYDMLILLTHFVRVSSLLHIEFLLAFL